MSRQGAAGKLTNKPWRFATFSASGDEDPFMSLFYNGENLMRATTSGSRTESHGENEIRTKKS